VLAAPSPASFGIESFGPVIKVAMAQTFERQTVRDGETLLPTVPAWPQPVAYYVPPEANVLPIPGAHNFKYSRPFRLGAPDKPKLAGKKPAAIAGTKPKEPGLFSPWPATRPRAVGHQLSVVRPPVNLNANAPQTQTR
jgi:hypothetical protein